MSQLEAATTEAMAAYRLNEAANELYHFTWHSFCDWYLEFAKPVLAEEGAAAAETRSVMAWSLSRILHLLHPFMPYITEELWGELGDGSIRLISDALAEPDPGLVDRTADAEIDWLIRLVSEIRAVRSEMNVPPAAKLELLVKDAGETSRERLSRHEGLIKRLARLTGIAALAGDVPKGAVQTVIDEATAVLPLAEVIDIAQEQARLQREIAKLAAEIAKTEKKLANEQFLSKAPDAVVAQQNDRLAEALGTRARLAAALERLGGA